MVPLPDIAAFLDRFLGADRFPEDPHGILAPAAGPVRRLGLALEPHASTPGWTEAHGIQAILLHRPWPRPDAPIPTGLGVLAYHLALDDRLTPGYSPRLADALELEIEEPLCAPDGRRVGMIGRSPAPHFEELVALAAAVFGGVEAVQRPPTPGNGRIAVAGAMTDALVREAAGRGATVYLTGQLRHPARAALAETGTGAIAVGHRRAELWALRALSGVLRDRWACLEVVVHDPLREEPQC